MRKLFLVGFLMLAPVVHAEPFSRGARCHDEVCFEQARSEWRQAVALADGRYAHRIDKMLAKWTKKGFPDTFIEKEFAKIDAQFRRELSAPGTAWFFEVQGYDRETTLLTINAIVNNAEVEINQALIPLWLEQAAY